MQAYTGGGGESHSAPASGRRVVHCLRRSRCRPTLGMDGRGEWTGRGEERVGTEDDMIQGRDKSAGKEGGDARSLRAGHLGLPRHAVHLGALRHAEREAARVGRRAITRMVTCRGTGDAPAATAACHRSVNPIDRPILIRAIPRSPPGSVASRRIARAILNIPRARCVVTASPSERRVMPFGAEIIIGGSQALERVRLLGLVDVQLQSLDVDEHEECNCDVFNPTHLE